jgi:hypothetical protein
MLRAYSDTMVYDRIAKGQTPRDDVEAVCSAQARGQLVVYPSVMDVEELLGQWETRRTDALLRLRKMRDTVGFSPMLKQPADLLGEAILAYAAGREPPPVTLGAEHQKAMADYAHGILDGDEGIVNEVLPRVVAEVRAMKAEFPRWWHEARVRVWDAFPASERRRVNFPAYFASDAEAWAEDIVRRRFGAEIADACRARGLDGLLALRPVRLCIGASMALVCDTTFGDGVQTSEPRPGDCYDFWHAIAASAADVFITDDRPFARRLKQVPIEGLRIVGSLRELLDILEGVGADSRGVEAGAAPAAAVAETAPS